MKTEKNGELIQASHGWRAIDLKEVWGYRDLLWVLTARDIKVRYKQTVLGCAWAVLQPLMSMVIFSVIFGHWAKLPSEGVAYPVFVYAALLPWALFANTVSSSGNSLVGSANLITKVYFPRIIIPLSSLGVALIDFLISLTIMIGLMFYYQLPFSQGFLIAPVLVLIILMASSGVGMFLSALNVAYRDFRYVIPVMIQVWMYATPVVYSSQIVPDRWKFIFYLNPMAGVIDGFRSVFLGNPFDWTALGQSAVIAAFIFLVGINYFRQAERCFSDIV
jgi:lipopolysaccharide transport system permease protein